MCEPATMMAIATSVVSSVASDFIGSKLTGGDKQQPLVAPKAETPELPAPESGGVDTIAAGQARRRRVSSLQARTGPQSTVLAGPGTGGSLGAG